MQLPVIANDVCNRPFSTPETIVKTEYSIIDINGKYRTCIKENYTETNCEGIKIIERSVGGSYCTMYGCYSNPRGTIMEIIDSNNQKWVISPSTLSRNGFVGGKKESQKCVNNLRVSIETTEYHIQGGYIYITEKTTRSPDLRRPVMD